MSDLVYRESVLKTFTSNGESSLEKTCLALINSVPTADATPTRYGQWNKAYKSGMTVGKGFVSSCCDMWNERDSNFCPYCGAKMSGGKINE